MLSAGYPLTFNIPREEIDEQAWKTMMASCSGGYFSRLAEHLSTQGADVVSAEVTRCLADLPQQPGRGRDRRPMGSRSRAGPLRRG